MKGNMKEIFRDIYNLADNYKDIETYKAGVKEICKKYDSPKDVVLIADISKLVANYLQ